MNSLSRGIATAVAAALIASLSFTALSVAHTRLFNSAISLSLNRVPGGDSASGQVTSSKAACAANRVVTVFEDVNPTAVFDFQAIGKAVSNATGAWSLPIQGGVKKGDTYFARISKLTLVRNSRHKHVCKGAYSAQVVGS
jgi:hypothetical protein